MAIIDTHTHIYDETFDDDIDKVITEARQAGVEYILLPNVDATTIEPLEALADKYPGYCLPMMGLHPTSVTHNWEGDLQIVKKQFALNKYIAVGEIGIDLYWDKSLAAEQKKAFEEQLRWSIEFDLPVSVHSRDAVMECIECVKNVGADKLRGSFHSFGGSEEELKEVIALENFYVGVNGTITYKNSTLPSFIAQAGLSRILIETDAPYLPPVPFRGKRNQPAYLSYIVEKLATIFEVSSEEVCNVTTRNAKGLFRITC